MKTPVPYFLMLTLFACGPKPERRPAEPPVEDFYQRLKEPLERMDLESVRGKSIVIDPGHGGVFRGAQGMGGTDEADVNLGVALYLWGLLEEAGARVVLTRRTDKDFVDGDAGKLRDDLQARVDTVVSVMPDVFVSIHHNAHFEGDRTFNEIQIYHKLRDSGPSLDLAHIFARHVRGNLGDANTRVMGGNYFVLRNSPVPSILCEPSFISNPAIESKLKLAEKQRLEAEVYFISLVDYFSRGTPKVAEIKPRGEVSEARPEIRVGFSQTSTIDLASVSVLLDGDAVELSKIGPNLFSAFPQAPLASGEHRLTATARSTGGNSSPEEISSFVVNLEPEILTMSAMPDGNNTPYPQKITALVLDENGNPVADSTRVSFTWIGGSMAAPTVGGRASVFLGEERPAGALSITARCEGLAEALDIGEAAGPLPVSGFVQDAAGSPIRGATLSTAGAGAPQAVPKTSAVTDEHGFFVLDGIRDDRPVEMVLEVSSPGYRKVLVPVEAGVPPAIKLKRIFEGLGTGQVITIDAAGGGDETGWLGPTGVKASDLNLALAQRLGGLYASAGLGVKLTRTGDQKVGPEQRVIASEDANSSVLISISHRENKEGKVILAHFPGSDGGNRIGMLVADEIELTTDYRTEVTETADYLIQQTSCPAVKVVFPVAKSVKDELDLTEPLSTWNRAYAVFYATLRYLGLDEKETFSASGRVTSAGKPVGKALLLIDGSMEKLADQEGRFSVRMLERGSHIIEAYSGTRRSAPLGFDENSGALNLDLE